MKAEAPFRKMWERFPDGRTICYWYRDSNGFCLLENRCWERPEKPCPKTQAAADRAWLALKQEVIDARAEEPLTPREGK